MKKIILHNKQTHQSDANLVSKYLGPESERLKRRKAHFKVTEIQSEMKNEK